MTYLATPTNFYEDYICHYGKKGMRWGHRQRIQPSGIRQRGRQKSKEIIKQASPNNTKSEKKKLSKGQKALIAGGITVGVIAAAYGGYKLHELGSIRKEANKYAKDMYKQKADWYKRSLNMDSDFSKDIKKEVKNVSINELKYRSKYKRNAFLDKVSPDAVFGSRTASMKSPLKTYKKDTYAQMKRYMSK